VYLFINSSVVISLLVVRISSLVIRYSDNSIITFSLLGLNRLDTITIKKLDILDTITIKKLDYKLNLTFINLDVLYIEFNYKALSLN